MIELKSYIDEKLMLLLKRNVFVESVGVELECGIKYNNKDWDKDANSVVDSLKGRIKNHKDFYVTGDGSVKVDNCHNCEFKYHGRMEDVKKWLKIMYEEKKVKTNKTCGFHIHLKFNEGIAPIVSSRSFWDMLKKEYKKKYSGNRKYMRRINNYHSQFNYYSITDHESAIDIECLRENKTIEIRIMPHQENYVESWETLDWTVRVVNTIVSELRNKKYEKKLREEIYYVKENFFSEIYNY